MKFKNLKIDGIIIFALCDDGNLHQIKTTDSTDFQILQLIKEQEGALVISKDFLPLPEMEKS